MKPTLQLTLVWVLLLLPLHAEGRWLRLSTPHFELLTTAGEKKGREAILYFEQVRSFFLESAPSVRLPEFPVRVVAFNSEKEYRPYRTGESAFAYYIPTKHRDYIVMQQISEQHSPAAIHEYTHLIIEHSGLTLPTWLNEGLAEVYSTLKPRGKKAMIGDLIPARMRALQASRLFPLSVLVTADHDSQIYNDPARAPLFYAESWALAHMLFLDPAYRPGFPRFLQQTDTGATFDQACQAAFSKTQSQVEVDLRYYLQGKRFFGVLYDVKLEKSAEEAWATIPSRFDSSLAEADLLAASHRVREASAAYAALARTQPGNAEVEASLGYLAWQEGDENSARRHFAQALANGSTDAQMCFHYAMLARTAHQGRDSVVALRRALEQKPDYFDARMELASLLMEQKNAAEAAMVLKSMKTVPSDRAYRFFLAMARAEMQAGSMADARNHANSARKHARTSEEIRRVDALISSMRGQ